MVILFYATLAIINEVVILKVTTSPLKYRIFCIYEIQIASFIIGTGLCQICPCGRWLPQSHLISVNVFISVILTFSNMFQFCIS